MKLTIIISYYRALHNLSLILFALNHQSCQNFEVILSEDDYNDETITYLLQHKNAFNYCITHIYQKIDDGFRKNNMLNKCINNCKTELIAFIDGDCIPHKHFVKAYINHLKTGKFLIGRSVLLGKEISKNILKSQSLEQLNFFALLKTDSTKLKEGIYSPMFSLSFINKGLVGRNWGICKHHLEDINGFDEDYITAGVGEDVDIEWRLMANGIKRKSIKNKAIVYHIYHSKQYSELEVQKNFELMYSKKLSNNIYCINGLLKN